MLGIGWEPHSPLKELVPIKLSAGSSKDKGKGKAIEAMDEGKSERERSVSLTVSKYGGAFDNEDSCFVYNWIDNEHGSSSLEGLKETEWLTNQSYHTGGKGTWILVGTC
jgi:hypothetical protein